MAKEKKWYLPEAVSFPVTQADQPFPLQDSGNSPAMEEEPKGPKQPCPCCGCLTIPPGGEATAYICPVCFWEMDCFISSQFEPSDQNHGMTLQEARENYKTYGAVLPRLKQYCRPPKLEELPEKTAE